MAINSTAQTNARESHAITLQHQVEMALLNIGKARAEREHSVSLEEKQKRTRSLIKDLFACKSQEQVDRVVVIAGLCSDSFLYEYGEEVDFKARIRNGELQVRDLISNGYDLSQINPDKCAFVVHTRDCSSLVDSWGHLSDRLMKGFALKL